MVKMQLVSHPYNNHPPIYNFLFHPLHGEGKAKKIAAIITNVFFTFITIGTWQIVFWTINRLDNKKIEIWKIECANEKTAEEGIDSIQIEQDHQAVDQAALPKAKVYFSITGGPTHLGHMMLIATAIDTLFKMNICVDEVKVSLSNQSYHQNKVDWEINNGVKKAALSQEAREYLLQGAIQEATKRGMFQGVSVNYWNDQDQGFSGHPDSYHRLAKLVEKTHVVYLLAGEDLRERMGDWPGIKHAIVVQRQSEKEQPSVYPSSTKDRIYVKPLPMYSEFANLSSTKIQNGTMSLQPPELQNYFMQAAGLIT